METVLHDAVLALHFLGLFMGGASGIGLPVIGARIGAAPPEHRQTLAGVARALKRIGQMGVAILLVTGFVLATMGGAWGTASVWFWIKLLAVAVLIGGIILADRIGPKAMAGDMGAAATIRLIGKSNLTALAVIVFAASFAFH